MKVAGRGRILFWEGASLWIMEALPARGAPMNATDFHAHHAIQVTLSLGGAFALRTQKERIAGAAIVAPDASHLFEAEGRIALVFVEPESQAGRAIASSRLGDAALAALPDQLVADLTARLAQTSLAKDAELESIGREIVARLAGMDSMAPLDARVRRMIDYAAAHLDNPISLSSAADIAGLSPSRARHLFVEQTGLPFRTYLLWLRITRAVGLFSGGSSLTEAAHEAGFADSAHFSRTFRRMFGLPAAALELL
jgi:AraC-like DNA-binding protein